MENRATSGEVVVLWLAWAAFRAAGEVCRPGFVPLQGFAVGANFGANALVDLDGDGALDLATGPFIFLGDGLGGLAHPIALGLQGDPSFDLGFADFDRDQRLDIALCQGGLVWIFFGEPGAGAGRRSSSTRRASASMRSSTSWRASSSST